MKWFTMINPDAFFEKAGNGLALIGGVFAVLLAVLVVLTVLALRRKKRTEDDDAHK